MSKTLIKFVAALALIVGVVAGAPVTAQARYWRHGYYGGWGGPHIYLGWGYLLSVLSLLLSAVATRTITAAGIFRLRARAKRMARRPFSVTRIGCHACGGPFAYF